MLYGKAAAIGAAFGTIGPILWPIALRAGHHVADGSGVLEAIAYVFPSSILFLGFPQADPAHPRMQIAAILTVGLVNILLFAILAVVVMFVWRLISRS